MRRLAVTLLALLAAACGGGGGDHPARPATGDKAGYVAAMRRYSAETARATGLLDRHLSRPQLQAALRDVADARTGMQHLRPPAEVREAHREYATAFAFSTGRLTAALQAELAGRHVRVARIEREDLPVQYRSDFNRALLVFGETGYAIR
jgi:hypothetical protein